MPKTAVLAIDPGPAELGQRFLPARLTGRILALLPGVEASCGRRRALPLGQSTAPPTPVAKAGEQSGAGFFKGHTTMLEGQGSASSHPAPRHSHLGNRASCKQGSMIWTKSAASLLGGPRQTFQLGPHLPAGPPEIRVLQSLQTRTDENAPNIPPRHASPRLSRSEGGDRRPP